VVDQQLTLTWAAPIVGTTRRASSDRVLVRDKLAIANQLAGLVRDMIATHQRNPFTPIAVDQLVKAVALYDTAPTPVFMSDPVDNGTPTSVAAATNTLVRAGTQRHRVLVAIANAGTTGTTDDELEQALTLRHQTLSARRRELAISGHIRAEGTRPTRSGSLANVWHITPAGTRTLDQTGDSTP
jgi:hypothetical protein